jgi:hypothetical protein
MDKLPAPLPSTTTPVQSESLGTLPIRVRMRRRPTPLSSLPTPTAHTSLDGFPPHHRHSDGEMAVSSLPAPDSASHDYAAYTGRTDSNRQPTSRIYCIIDGSTGIRRGFPSLWFLYGLLGSSTRTVPAGTRLALVGK